MGQQRVCVVGLGHNGLAWIGAYGECEGTEVVGVCDLSPERQQQGLAAAPGARSYGDLSEMLDRERPDVLSVHTPDHLHAGPFVMGLEAGCHVVVEKPAGNSLEDLEAMTSAARASDRKTLVGQVLRFNPLYEELKRQIAEGVFGELFYLEADYIHNLLYQGSADRVNPHIGNVNWYLEHEVPMIGGGIHPLDLLRWFAGARVEEVTGYGNHLGFPAMRHHDCMVAMFRFEGGACAKVATLYAPVGPMAPQYNLSIYGTKATYRDGELMVGSAEDFEVRDLRGLDIHGHPFLPEVEHLVACIEQDLSPRTDIFEGANSAAAVILAARSVETGLSYEVPRYAR